MARTFQPQRENQPQKMAEAGVRRCHDAVASQPAGGLAQLAGELNSSPQVAQLRSLQAIANSMTPELQPGTGPGPASFVPVQLLMSDEDFSGRMKITKKDDLTLRYIPVLLYLYQDIAEEKYQERLKMLRRLDEHIYELFDKNKSPDLDSDPRAEVMRELMEESEKEHAGIIRDIQYAKTDELPIDVTGLDEETITQVRELWKGLLTGKSNIKLQTGGRFAAKMLPRITKLLQTPFGRQLIGELSKPQDDPSKQIRIVPNLPKSVDEGKKDSFAKPIEEARAPQSLSERIFGAPVIRDQHELLEANDPLSPDEDYPKVTGTQELNQAIMKGESKGVTWGGKRYRFNTGQGSYVRIQDDKMPKVDKNLNPVISPGFVSLGHELGHALRILRGGSIASPTLYNERAAEYGLNPETGSLDQQLWSELEEYVNINEVENQIRKEHGITARAFHATKVTAILNKRLMTELLNKILAEVDEEYRSYVQGPISKICEQLFYAEDWDFGDRKIVKRTKEELLRWKEDIPAIMKYAKTFYDLRDRYHAVFNGRSGLDFEDQLSGHPEILEAMRQTDRIVRNGYFESGGQAEELQKSVLYLEKSVEVIREAIKK